MKSIFFNCPVCGCKDKDIVIEESFFTGDLIECPECLNILLVNGNYDLEDFKDILLEQSSKRRAESKLTDPDSVCVKSLEGL